MSLLYPQKSFSFGLLILRIGIGLSFIAHGYPKVVEGGYTKLAAWVASAGIPMAETAALMAGLAEFVGGMFFIVGLLFRPTALVMCFTMVIATYMHLKGGHDFMKYSHAMESAIIFFSAMITGPGSFSADAAIFKNKN